MTNESEQPKERRMPVRQTATYKRAHVEFVKCGREFHYRLALLGGKQLGAVACNAPSIVLGPELDKCATDYADAWAAYERAGNELQGLKDTYGDSYRMPCVDENDEIIPDPERSRR